ncbi:hypothetical protein GALMADRAFT_139735 [Galerina marginata CBS 339.88]|uniref:Uncharacterized protein n=1 Tax=Galerina marginata (strain CBS 339.88) TaxID=685588 RepID=A0A067SYI4_GALM3|nr:hypothetical protein GALMADRAFT_139735 [Galerina marginata CBS 339.88]
MQKSATQLTSLAQWSQNHIKDIFESPTDEDCVRAIDETFCKNVHAVLNGKPLGLEQIKQSVLAIRKEAHVGLTVEWKHTVEVPASSDYRDGSFGGVYFIHGIQRLLTGSQEPAEFVRHKTVTVKIESQSTATDVDSRKIVDLVFVAADIQMQVNK